MDLEYKDFLPHLIIMNLSSYKCPIFILFIQMNSTDDLQMLGSLKKKWF